MQQFVFGFFQLCALFFFGLLATWMGSISLELLTCCLFDVVTAMPSKTAITQ